VPKSRLVGLSVLLAVGATSLPLLVNTTPAVASARPGTAAGWTPRTPAVPMEECHVGRQTTATLITGTTSPPVVVGQPIEIDVEVVNQCPGSGGTPSGSVRVSDGTHHCGAAVFGSYTVATGNCRITEDADGTYTFNAAYRGNALLAPSATATGTPVTVGNRETSTTALTLSVTTITYGDEQVENLTATVSPEFTGTPTGTVRIKASNTRLCVITLSGAEGSCTLSATQLQAGTYDVVAHYSGSMDFKSSASSTETLTVTS
jgi:Bacterial Ig-like domain (group 3)